MFETIGVIERTALAILLGSASLVAQQTATAGPTSSPAIEFPVIMRQKIEAGKTIVGTKVEAKLVVATNVNNVVIPRNAILVGEVTESTPKSETTASRIAVRIDSAEWKNGSTPIHGYLTAWFYPVAEMAPQDLAYEPRDATNSNKNWNGMGPYPSPGNPVTQEKFPGRDSDKASNPAPATPASNISKHRVQMKDVDSERSSDGRLSLSSKRNIKLDKSTTYVVATGDLLP